MNDTKFVNGLLVKAPKDGAPDFVKASLSIKRLELIEWLQGQDGDWVNVDLKSAKTGKWYASVNEWKPSGGASSSQGSKPVSVKDGFEDDDLPF